MYELIIISITMYIMHMSENCVYHLATSAFLYIAIKTMSTGYLCI